MAQTSSPDPFFLEIFKSRLETIANQMALTMLRSAHSAILRDSIDFSTALTDPHGATLAQGLTCPVHLGTFQESIQTVLTLYSGDIADGDVFVFNDPYVAAGQHLPDIYVVKPIFWQRALVAFAATVGHHSDVGGIVPGSNAIGSTEIFQEGLRLPVLKLLDSGQRVEPVWRIIALNVRTPEDVLGDLQSQVGACMIAAQEIRQLHDDYGQATVAAYCDFLQDYSERLARASIREIPDGIYGFVDHIDGLGADPEPIEIRVQVIVTGDEICVDWTGSAAQVAGGLNSVLCYTRASSFAAIRSIMPQEVPNCQGFTRPITVVAPLGSIVNAAFPAACGVKGLTGYRMIDCLFGALAQAVPLRVTADGSGGSTLPTISGHRDGKAYVFSETVAGNYGASASHDGQDGVAHIGANHTNVPVENIEARFPIRIRQYGLVTDSGGPGRFRGGVALVREYELLGDTALLQVRSDKRRFPPHGLEGGCPGTGSMNDLRTRDPTTQTMAWEVLPALLTAPRRISAGDRFRHTMSGGGGFGPPQARDPALVLADVLDGLVSVAQARARYRVGLTADASPAIDWDETTRLRREEDGS